jgi:hypothetical protein
MKKSTVKKTVVKKIARLPFLLLCLALSACAPKVGSDAWCANMKEKDRGDWSMNEAADFARHCILR